MIIKRKKIIKLLLEKGADINLKDTYGKTISDYVNDPLYEAIKNANETKIKYLEEKVNFMKQLFNYIQMDNRS